MSRELSGHVGAPHTPAGTFSLALARISWRSVGNSEIVLVATVATDRALRPVASVLDTIFVGTAHSTRWDDAITAGQSRGRPPVA